MSVLLILIEFLSSQRRLDGEKAFDLHQVPCKSDWDTIILVSKL
jgi:hypothetical protein